MKQKTTLSVLLLLIVLSLPNCKKSWNGTKYEIPLAAYVVSTSALNVYSAPDLSAKVVKSLPSNSEFKILEHKIVNPAFEKIRWYKISLENEIAFLSEQVEEKKEISSFQELSKPEEAFVFASSLRVRKNPSLTGEVITSLPRNTKIEILANGIQSEEIDGKNDKWVKIKTNDGKIGFCFRGYLLFSLNPEWKEEAYPGYIKIKNSNVLQFPTGEKFNDKEKSETINFHFSVAENFIYPVKTKATVNGKTFYSVEESFSNCGQFDCEGNGIVYFWIAEEDVDYFNSSISEYTFKEFGFENEDLFKYVVSKIGKNVDVRNIKVEPVGENAEGTSFWKLSLDLDTPYYKNGQDEYQGIVQKSNGQYSEVYTEKNGSYISMHDFDKDGVSEIQISSGGRMNSDTTFYAIKNKRLVKLLELESGEYYIDNGNSYNANFEIKNDRILFSKTQNEKTNNIVYLYQNGKFVKEK